MIKLPKIALDVLKRQRDKSNGATDEGWSFPTKNGNPVDAHNFIHRPGKRMLRKAGLPETTRYHDLRHGAASLLLSRGYNAPVFGDR
jgi:integrase